MPDLVSSTVFNNGAFLSGTPRERINTTLYWDDSTVIRARISDHAAYKF